MPARNDSARPWAALLVVLALVFFLSGAAKLLAMDFEVQAFTRWGYPLWFMYLTGLAEIAGAAGLLVKRLSGLAALGLTGLMTGAVLTHVMHAEVAMGLIAALIWGAAASVAWRRRQEVLVLLGRRRGTAI